MEGERRGAGRQLEWKVGIEQRLVLCCVVLCCVVWEEVDELD